MESQPFKRLMLVVNPHSGRGLSNSTLGIIVNRLCADGFCVTVYMTGLRSAEELTAGFGAGYDLIVCVGGDGTLSGAISGLMRLASPPPVGYIPTGTANDIASTLSLPRDPQLAIQSIIKGVSAPFDIGCFGDKYFAYIAAFGAFTGVSYLTPQSAKRALGHLAYILGGLADLSAIKPRHTIVEHDGGVVEGSFIFGGVTNSTSVAGLAKLSPSDVNLSDGLFEVVLVRQPVSIRDLSDIIASIIKKSYQSDNVRMLHTSKVRFKFDEAVAWTRDGEDGGVHTRVEIKNMARAVRILLGGSSPLATRSQLWY
ncbi:MAG: YegS/Rv2252/BmrU family lipid kinase [Oscillospiraceae bacterium]|jgi:YegS/Rv2252/BmrU family lipid kinase|nr:YegS/Rv2252/BmrU family lipid kinase [Oscillospiraceae bacterium]